MIENEPEILAPTARSGRPRLGLFWPLLLVAVGVLVLLRNLGMLEGDAWDVVMRLWPVILIVLGLDVLFSRSGFAGGLFLIGLGVIFLLTNFNLVNRDVWEMALRLWPLLLVAYGLNLILGRRSAWGTIFSAIVVLALLAGAVWWMVSGGSIR